MKMISKTGVLIIAAMTSGTTALLANEAKVNIPDTGQIHCYNSTKSIIYPQKGGAFFGQDAHYQGRQPAYRDHGDGTVTDLVTGLMWSKAVDSQKVSLAEAERMAGNMTLGGYSDWRVPNIKELYSLIDFNGYTGFEQFRTMHKVPANAVPYINTDFFDFKYGNTAAGERYIDGQWLSSTKYVSTTMDGNKTLFGVNFADGRIKGYPYERLRNNRQKKFYVRYVRGGAYGHNNFVDNGDGTVTDTATGLMWMKRDNGKGMNWHDALAYAETQKLAGYNDWRLPNAKELQYIVDYTRSPDTTRSAAIDPVFETTEIKNEAGEKDYPCFWTSTTHLDGPRPGKMACYVAFGRALGQMHGQIMDVHGAGAQRSDPKYGKAAMGHGPQGDARRVYNFVRCVRGGDVNLVSNVPELDKNSYPLNYKAPVADSSIAGRNQRTLRGSHRQTGFQSQSRGGYRHVDHRKMFMQRLDRDRDGKVSRQEFDGPNHHFSHFDKNRDSFITEDEAPRHPPRGRRH